MTTDVAGIEVRISGDAAQGDIRRLEGALERLVRRAGSTEGAFDRLSDHIDDMGGSLGKAGQDAKQTEGAFSHLRDRLTSLQSAVSSQLEGAFNRISSRAGDVRDSFSGLAERIAKARDSISEIGRGTQQAEGNLENLINRADNAGNAFDRLADHVIDANDSLSNTDEDANRAESAFGRLRDSVFSLQGAIAGLGLAGFSQQIVSTTQTWDRLANTLRFATGSAQGSADSLAFVRAEAERLGLAAAEAGQGFAIIAAAAKDTALEGKATRDIFLAVAEAGAVLGLTANDMQETLLAVSQVMSKGKVSAEELRGQIGERIPGAFNIAAQAMGATTQELDKMLESGTLLAEDFLPKFAAQMRTTFGGDALNAANGLTASINRLGNAWDDFLLALGETGVIDAFTAGIKGAAVGLRALADNMDRVVQAATILAAAAAPAALAYITKGALEAAAAVRLLTVAIAANPLGLLAVAVSASISALVAFRDELITIRDRTAAVTDFMRAAWNETLGRLSDEASTFFKTIQDYAGGWANEFIVGIQAVGAGFSELFVQIGKVAAEGINGVIGLFVGFARVAGDVANRLIDSFSLAFTRIQELAAAMWQSIAAGDFSFSGLRESLKRDVEYPIADLAESVDNIIKTSIKTDYIRPALADFSRAVTETTDSIGKSFTDTQDAIGKTAEGYRLQRQHLTAAQEAAQRYAVSTTSTAKAVSSVAAAAGTANKEFTTWVQSIIAAAAGSDALAAAYAKGNDAIVTATRALDAEQAVLRFGAANRAKITDLINKEANARDRLDLAKTAFELRREAQELTDHGRAVLAGVDALRQYNVEKEVSEALAGKNADAIGAETEALRKAAQERARAQQFQEATGDIESLIRETATPLEQYKARLAEIDQLETDLRQGGGPISQKAEQALQRARVEAEGIVDATNPMAQVFEDTASRIHQAFTGLFEGIFDRGLDSFKDLGRGILDFFKRTLAQMASLALARPVLVPVVTALGGALGISAAAQGGVLGQLGLGGTTGAAGAAGVAGTQNIGLLASLGNLFGGNGIGAGAGNLFNSLGTFAYKAGLEGAGFALGRAGSSLAGTSNLALGGAGLLGGLGGNLIGGLFGGRGATGGSLGGGAGASLGLAFGGPVGALIGGLLGSVGGGLLGSLFGDVKQPFASLGTSQQAGRFNTETLTKPSQGALGFIQFIDEATKRINYKELQQFTDGLAQLDTALAQSLQPEQIDRIRTALDGFVTAHQRGAISFEEMARQRLGVVVDALGDRFDSLASKIRSLPVEEAYAAIEEFIVRQRLTDYLESLGSEFAVLRGRIEKLPVDEAYRLIEAFGTLLNQMPALNQQIALLSSDALGALRIQVQAMDRGVSEALRSLRSAIDADDLTAAAQAMGVAQAAIIDRYQSEVQLAQDLAAQIEDIGRGAAQFQADLAERIARLQPGGGRAVEALYLNRERQLQAQINASDDPSRRLELLQEFTAAYDAWFQAVTDRVGREADAQVQALERQKDVAAEAAQVRIDGLQAELDLAQQWASVVESSRRLIDNLRFSGSNPLPTGARLALAQGAVSAARTRFATSTGEDRQGAAEDLLEALERQLEIGQEIYARPSTEYLRLYNQTVSEITALQRFAAAQGGRAEDIQAKIAAVQEGQAKTVASIDQQIAQVRQGQENTIAFLQNQAANSYRAIQQFGANLAAQASADARQHLNVLTGGLAVDQFIAQQQSRAVTLLTEIRDRISGVLAGNFAVGTDYVPRSGLAMIHQGERILTVNENRTFGLAVDRMLAQGAVPHFQGGGYVPRETVAVLHAGETVVPAGEGGGINVTVPVNVTVNGSGGDPVRLAEDIIRRVRRELPEAIVQAAPLLKKRLRTA